MSYFLSTDSMGSHDFKAGSEDFTITRTGGNSQSSTNYVFNTDSAARRGRPPRPRSGRPHRAGVASRA